MGKGTAYTVLPVLRALYGTAKLSPHAEFESVGLRVVLQAPFGWLLSCPPKHRDSFQQEPLSSDMVGRHMSLYLQCKRLNGLYVPQLLPLDVLGGVVLKLRGFSHSMDRRLSMH